MKFRLLICLSGLLATGATQAQERALPLWEAGVFAGVASTPAYPGSSDRSQRALAVPFFIYRGEVLRADRGGIGARVMRTDDLEFDVGFAASLPANSKNVTARAGMPDMGTLIEFGPRLKMTLAKPTAGSRWKLELPVRTVLEFSGGMSRQGWAAEPEVSYESRDLVAGLNLSANASLVFGDRSLNQYFYSVAPRFASPTRPTFDAKAGLIATRLGLSLSKEINADLRVFGFLRYDSYAGTANLNSPLHLNASGSSAGLGLTWTFGRSTELARN
jgi:outer membrane scaffolding protein for murein synthesis (MipA/OmpV family)